MQAEEPASRDSSAAREHTCSHYSCLDPVRRKAARGADPGPVGPTSSVSGPVLCSTRRSSSRAQLVPKGVLEYVPKLSEVISRNRPVPGHNPSPAPRSHGDARFVIAIPLGAIYIADFVIFDYVGTQFEASRHGDASPRRFGGAER